MNPIEFEKKCHPYNKLYVEIFGYVPCRWHYKCNQTEYFNALLKSIETKQELTVFLKVRKYDFSNPNVW